MFECSRVKCINNVYFHRRIREGSTTTSKHHSKSFIGCSIVLLKMMNTYSKIYKKKHIEDAICIDMGYMFGNAIYRYCYMRNCDRKANMKLVKKIKKVAKEMRYFNRKDYKLFCHASFFYVLLRKFYDKFKLTCFKMYI